MPAGPRPRRDPTDDWDQLRLLVGSPARETYERLRPIVRFGQPIPARARESAVPERTLRRTVARFDAAGVGSLFDLDALAPPTIGRRLLPSDIRRAIAELKAEYPPFGLREIATICRHRFDRPVRYHTVRAVLASDPLPIRPPRRFPRYHETADPVARRRAVVTRLLDGWSAKAIAGYLEASRQTVYEVLRRWDEEGWPGLADRPFGPLHPARKVDLRAMAASRRLHANPELGEFRIHAGLAQTGIELSPRTCGRILARAFSPRQDLTADLIVLRAAVEAHGAPEVLVSDGGGVFKAKQAQVVSAALGIRNEQIDAGQAWQHYIETPFNIMRRMADYHSARATTWAELQAVHDRFFADDKHQPHDAHRERTDGRRSPAAVLGWVQGAWCDPADLDRVFRLRASRRLNAGGSVRFRHWRLYGERGLAGERVAVWVWDETVTIAYAAETLAQYRVTYEADRHHLCPVAEPRLYATGHASPQPFLPVPEETEWRPALRRVPDRPGRSRREEGHQERLFPLAGEVAAG